MLLWFGAYLAAITLSAAFGASPWRSFFGDFERMGGVWSWLHFAAYYVVLRATMNGRWWRILLTLTLIVADITVLGAPLFSFGRGFSASLVMGSALGNPGLLGPFLLLSIAIAGYLIATEAGAFTRGIAAVSIVCLLVGIVFSENRSAEIGLVVGFLFGACVLLRFHVNRRVLLRWYAAIFAIALLAAGAAGVALRTRTPTLMTGLASKWRRGSPLTTERLRIIEWHIAGQGFADRPLLGYGPENHRVIESAHFDPEVYDISPEIVFDRAHNAWLELLATTGLIGTLAMIGIWVAAAQTIRRGIAEKKLTAAEAAIFAGGLVSYAVFVSFWFFDISSVMLWLALLALISGKVRGPLFEPEAASSAPSRRWLTLAAAGFAIIAAVYFESVVPLRAARDLDAAIQTDEGVDEHLAAFYRVMDSSAPQIFHTAELFNQYLGDFDGLLKDARENPSLDQRLRIAFRRGFNEDTRNISRDPLNDRAYLERARLLVYAGDFYADTSEYSAAARSMWSAIRLSPKRTYNRVFLSDVYLKMGDTLSAKAQLDSVRRMTPRYYLLPDRLVKLGMTP